jgi:hypothetical protein
MKSGDGVDSCDSMFDSSLLSGCIVSCDVGRTVSRVDVHIVVL